MKKNARIDRSKPRMAMAVGAMVFASCVPFEEPVRHGQAPAMVRQESAPKETVEEPRVEPRARSETKETAPKGQAPLGPVELSPRMHGIAGDMLALDSDGGKVEHLFNTLRSGAEGGLKAMDMEGRAPRTAGEAFVEGGDCTELALVTATLLIRTGVPGGVRLVRFEGSDEDHMIAYASIRGKDTVIDLQAGKLGRTKDARYRVLMDVPLDKAAWMYHREMGDHLMDQKDHEGAAREYGRARTINGSDPYVLHNLAVAHERSGRMEEALEAIGSAIALDSGYSKAGSRIRYNAGINLGAKAFGEKRYGDCAEHFRMALDSGEELSQDERTSLEANISTCTGKAR